MGFLLVSDEMVKETITPGECLAAVEEGFRLHAGGRVVGAAARALLGEGGDSINLYAAQVPGYGLAAKVLGAHEGNPARGQPYIQAYVLALDGESGSLVALLEGRYLTALRTAAATALGARALARGQSRALGILGTGLQARTHLLCHLAAHPFERAMVWGRSPKKVAAYLEEMQLQVPIPLEARPSPEAVCAEADVLACTTRARRPLFAPGAVRPGTHIGVAGPLRSDGQEVPLDLVRANLLFVDLQEKFLPLWQAGSAPAVEAELGAVLLGQAPGRPDDEAITVFKPVGMAFEDVVSAAVVLRNLRARGLQRVIRWKTDGFPGAEL